MFKKICFSILCFMLVFLFQAKICIAFEATYVWSDISEDAAIASTIPDDTSETNNALNLESASAVLLEQNTGTVLYNHNMHEKLRPASVTKVMTILLIMEALDTR